jgi:hypothetical protein
MGKLVDQMAFYGSSLILPKLAITRETSFPALTAFAACSLRRVARRAKRS